ncbi:MAG: hypothetical protein WC444_04315 [Candidatus Paceibacterota bacterium]
MNDKKYDGIEGFVKDLGCDVRECIDCGCLTPGGPTRCKRCASEIKSDEFVYHCLGCNKLLSEEEHKEHNCNKNGDLFMMSGIEAFKNKVYHILKPKLSSAREELERCLENMKEGAGTIPHFRIENVYIDEKDPTKVHCDVRAHPDLIEFMLNHEFIKLTPTEDGYTFSTEGLDFPILGGTRKETKHEEIMSTENKNRKQGPFTSYIRLGGKGAITLVWDELDDGYKVGISFCAPCDKFDKNRGGWFALCKYNNTPIVVPKVGGLKKSVIEYLKYNLVHSDKLHVKVYRSHDDRASGNFVHWLEEFLVNTKSLNLK